jgi:hypothetical protein
VKRLGGTRVFVMPIGVRRDPESWTVYAKVKEPDTSDFSGVIDPTDLYGANLAFVVMAADIAEAVREVSKKLESKFGKDWAIVAAKSLSGEVYAEEVV